MDGLTQPADLLKNQTPKKILETKTSMKKFGDLSMLTRIHFHGKEEGMKTHIQSMDGPTQLADLLKNQTPKKILETRTLMKKFGDSSTLTRTPFHGKEEEMKILIQSMDGLIQLADLLKNQTPKKTFQTKTLMRKFGDSSTLTRTPFHGKEEEMKILIQPMVG